MRPLNVNEISIISGGEASETHDLYFNTPGKELVGVSLEIADYEKEPIPAGNIFNRCYNFMFSFANIFLNWPTSYNQYPIYDFTPIYK